MKIKAYIVCILFVEILFAGNRVQQLNCLISLQNIRDYQIDSSQTYLQLRWNNNFISVDTSYAELLGDNESLRDTILKNSCIYIFYVMEDNEGGFGLNRNCGGKLLDLYYSPYTEIIEQKDAKSKLYKIIESCY